MKETDQGKETDRMAKEVKGKQIAQNVMTVDQEKKNQALDVALANIEKQFGKGAIMKLGDAAGSTELPVIPTGCLELDIALGVGGVPRGRIIEIYGPESSGKTTIALHIIAEAQKMGGAAAFVDAEHALDPTYAKALGVDIDNLYVSQPSTGEEGLEITEALVRSGAIDVVVVDSVAALVPRAEIDGVMGDSHVGLQARLMSQALRKLTASINRSNTVVIFINQLREKVGVIYGSPEVTTGGKALKFYATIRMDIRKGEAIKNGDQTIGNRTKIKVVKNKVAPPFKIAEFEIYYGEGVSKSASIFNLAVQQGIVVKSGSWFSYEGNQIGQGKENARRYFDENPEEMERLQQRILSAYHIGEEEQEAGEESSLENK